MCVDNVIICVFKYRNYLQSKGWCWLVHYFMDSISNQFISPNSLHSLVFKLAFHFYWGISFCLLRPPAVTVGSHDKFNSTSHHTVTATASTTSASTQTGSSESRGGKLMRIEQLGFDNSEFQCRLFFFVLWTFFILSFMFYISLCFATL